MSMTWWIIAYVLTAAFLAWIAFARGLESNLGRNLAMVFVEGSEPMTHRGIRWAAAIIFFLETAWFVVGIANPAFRF